MKEQVFEWFTHKRRHTLTHSVGNPKQTNDKNAEWHCLKVCARVLHHHRCCCHRRRRCRRRCHCLHRIWWRLICTLLMWHNTIVNCCLLCRCNVRTVNGITFDFALLFWKKFIDFPVFYPPKNTLNRSKHSWKPKENQPELIYLAKQFNTDQNISVA